MAKKTNSEKTMLLYMTVAAYVNSVERCIIRSTIPLPDNDGQNRFAAIDAFHIAYPGRDIRDYEVFFSRGLVTDNVWTTTLTDFMETVPVEFKSSTNTGIDITDEAELPFPSEN